MQRKQVENAKIGMKRYHLIQFAILMTDKWVRDRFFGCEIDLFGCKTVGYKMQYSQDCLFPNGSWNSKIY